MGCESAKTSIRILCPKLVIIRDQPGLQWLIGSPFLPELTIASTIRSIHNTDYFKESDDLRTLLPKGFEVIGALIVGNDSNYEQTAAQAITASIKLRRHFYDGLDEAYVAKLDFVGATADLTTGDAHCFISRSGDLVGLKLVNNLIYEDQPQRYIWEGGCLVRCQLPVKLPVYYNTSDLEEVEDLYSHATDAVVAKLNCPQATYMIEALGEPSTGIPCPAIIRQDELNFQADLWNASRSNENAKNADGKSLTCSYFCSKTKDVFPFNSVEENAEKIQVSILVNSAEKSAKSFAPIAEYFPAPKDAKLLVVDHNIEVVCYASKDLPLKDAISKLILPGLIDQLRAVKNIILPNVLGQHCLLHPYHFCPPGVVHPITAIYELNYGETEMKQGEV